MFKKLLLKVVILSLMVYVLICVCLYFFQERLIFFPHPLAKAFSFAFPQPFEELSIAAQDGKHLNALLFTTGKPKGLVFYLHGNAGALDTWGEVAKRYTMLQYDVCILDYRGYGKSDGTIKSEAQLYADIQAVYNTMKQRYKESDIVIIGYSIGCGPASWLASVNHAKLLLLQAPYYSLTDIMRRVYPIVPTFLLRYKFETCKYVQQCIMPIVIFHGDEDEVIPYASAFKMKTVMKPADTFITLKGQGHNGITDNATYIHAIANILQ